MHSKIIELSIQRYLSVMGNSVRENDSDDLAAAVAGVALNPDVSGLRIAWNFLKSHYVLLGARGTLLPAIRQ